MINWTPDSMVWWSGDTIAYYYTQQVGVAFNQSNASPGDSINVATVTSPGSVVLLSVIDKSLTLLADACKSLESDNVSYQKRVWRMQERISAEL